ncbi:hypothetical protein F4774DRAFT_400039 [Daldinia eschscholtzii]|nr:hypothetical protein F4774DRAFT_400039 [Daldinia eschscholtzii]
MMREIFSVLLVVQINPLYCLLGTAKKSLSEPEVVTIKTTIYNLRRNSIQRRSTKVTRLFGSRQTEAAISWGGIVSYVFEYLKHNISTPNSENLPSLETCGPFA